MQSGTIDLSRRSLLKNSLITAGLFPLFHSDLFASSPAETIPLKVHIFSKHLQFLNFTDMAEAAAKMGFDGIDLTVRPAGHVLPERVDTDLPKAVEAMRNAGLAPVMMTTAIEDAGNALDKRVLEAAAKQGIQFYRMNWYAYPEDKTMPE